MKNILIVGMGKMGHSHYQALTKSSVKKNIFLYDKNLSAFKKLDIINNRYNKSEIIKSINYLNCNIDLLILSTTSENRYQILFGILSKIKIKKIIFEKFLFQNKDDYEKAQKILNKKKIKSWVHLPFREAVFFSQLKKEINKKNIFIMRSIGGDWSMASNIIHTIDIFTYLIGSQNLEILSKEFNEKIIRSKKRKKYDEVDGHIYIKGICKHYLEISKDINSKRPKEFEFITKNNHYIIQNKKILIRNIDNWNFKVKKFDFPNLKLIGKKMYNDILQSGTSNLPTFDESIKTHKMIFSIFDHIKKNNRLNIT